MDNQFIRLYSEKNYENLSLQFLKNIEFYGTGILKLNKQNYSTICSFVETFLNLFIKEDFIIPEEHFGEYLKLHPFISSLVCISNLNNTDDYLKLLTDKNYADITFSKNIFFKILLLYSSRNKLLLNYQEFFDYDNDLSSSWYLKYFETNNYVSEVSYQNFQRHLDCFEQISDKLEFNNNPSLPYFSSTYCHPDKDKKIKYKMNTIIRELYKDIVFFNKPEPKKIGIISRYLIPTHSVHRGTFRFIETLKDDYDLTLIHLGNWKDNIDIRIFNKVIQIETSGNKFDHSKLDNNFSLVFYPDIGMSTESMILSNLRLAPVQVTGHGHSVSTFGSQIDYFITGSESEEIENLSENYSERPVVIPGLGLLPTYHTYQIRNIKKTTEDFIIICPWTIQKINYPHLLNLQKILQYSEKKIKFHFLTATMPDSRLSSFAKELTSILGRINIEIHSHVEYQKYMSLFEAGDMAIDSFHFGGYNTIIDAIYLNKPVITLEGNKAYNKFAAALLRSIGLEELISVNSEEYIRKILKIINNDNYRNSLINKIKGKNLQEMTFNSGMEKYFKKAIDFLIEHHHELINNPGREPIIIE